LKWGVRYIKLRCISGLADGFAGRGGCASCAGNKEERKASAWCFSRCHYSSEAKPGVVRGAWDRRPAFEGD
jgi:hypothetical protein